MKQPWRDSPARPTLSPGVWVFIAAPHAFAGRFGVLVSYERFLGGMAWRVRLEGNTGECFAQPDELRTTMSTEPRVLFAVEYIKGTMYGAAVAAAGCLIGAVWLRAAWLLWSCLVCECVSALAWVFKRELEKPEERP